MCRRSSWSVPSWMRARWPSSYVLPFTCCQEINSALLYFLVLSYLLSWTRKGAHLTLSSPRDTSTSHTLALLPLRSFHYCPQAKLVAEEAARREEKAHQGTQKVLKDVQARLELALEGKQHAEAEAEQVEIAVIPVFWCKSLCVWVSMRIGRVKRWGGKGLWKASSRRSRSR